MAIIDRDEAIQAGFSRLRQFARYSVGRLLGTIAASRGPYKFALELAESRHFHRVELNALTGLLIKKGMFTATEWTREVDLEIEYYEKAVAAEWPECKPERDGRSYALDVKGASKRCADEGWPA